MKPNPKKEAGKLIQELEDGNYSCKCPCCGKPVLLKNTNLFYSNQWPSPEVKAIYIKILKEQAEKRREVRAKRTVIPEHSERGSFSSNFGKTVEKLVPVLQKFRSRFHVNDWRPLFDPIDFIIFDGLSLGRKINEIIFTEVKTNDGVLSKHQKQIRSIVRGKEGVKWLTY